MEDITPRLTPPPKPAVMELSTPKHAVPEVSLVCDGDSSLTWQASQPNVRGEKIHPLQNLKKIRVELNNQEFASKTPKVFPSQPLSNIRETGPAGNSLGKNPNFSLQSHPQHTERLPFSERRFQETQESPSPHLPSHTQDSVPPNLPSYTHRLPHTEKRLQEMQDSASPSLPSHTQDSVPSNLPSHTQRLPLTERRFQETQYTVSPSCVNPPAPHLVSKEYNPQVYSPTTKHFTRGAPVSQGHIVPRRYSSSENVIFSTPQGFSSRAAEDTVPSPSAGGQGSLGTLPTAVRDMRQEKSPYPTTEDVSNNIRTRTLPSLQNKMFTNSQNFHQTGLANSVQSYDQRPAGYHEWSSPVSSSHPVAASSNVIHGDRNYYVSQTWRHPDPHTYSPNPLVNRLHSPADPVVYHMIEDQKHQIHKLTRDLQKIMERQETQVASSSRAEKVPETARAIKQPVINISTQTDVLDVPATRSIGINTDISWSELVASIRSLPVLEEAAEQTGWHHSRKDEQVQLKYKSRNSPLLRESNRKHKTPHARPHMQQERETPSVKQVTAEQYKHPYNHHTGRRTSEDYEESLSLSKSGDLSEDSTSSSDQEGDHARLHSPPPPPRDPLGEKCLVPRDNPPATGTTFYNNVLTNIQQILQHTSPPQEQHKDPPSQGVAESAIPEEASTDPHIEAVRKQLHSFGISFLDPVTLAPTHRTVVDSLYLPGMHNMLSLYQSSVSTHYHHHSDATAAKYLTDPQLAAIAASSPAMKKGRGLEQHSPSHPSTGLSNHHLVKLNTNSDINVSITTRKFLEKYGLQED